MVKCFYVFSILIASLPFSLRGQIKEKQCKGISAEVEISNDKEGKKVLVKSDNFTSPVKYIFFNEQGERLGDDFNSNELGSLSAGEYFCVVKDIKGCSKTVQFKIESNTTLNE